MKLDVLLKVLDTVDYPADCEVVMDENRNLTVLNKGIIIVRVQIIPGSNPPGIAPVINAEREQKAGYRYAGPGKKGINWLLGRDQR